MTYNAFVGTLNLAQSRFPTRATAVVLPVYPVNSVKLTASSQKHMSLTSHVTTMSNRNMLSSSRTEFRFFLVLMRLGSLDIFQAVKTLSPIINT